MTKQKALILKIINESYDHMTVEEVYKKAILEMPTIALATVYNNINSLFKSGQIRKFVLTDGMAHYDKQIPHDHLVCEKCGTIIDVELGDKYSSILNNKALSKATGKNVVGYELIIKYDSTESQSL